MTDWYVGQNVYVVPNDERQLKREAKIASISRKWMTLDPSWVGQFSKHDGLAKPAKGYLPEAKLWPSKAAYEEWRRLDEKWRELVRRIQYRSVPDHLAKEDLDKIFSMVFGDD